MAIPFQRGCDQPKKTREFDPNECHDARAGADDLARMVFVESMAVIEIAKSKVDSREMQEWSRGND